MPKNDVLDQLKPSEKILYEFNRSGYDIIIWLAENVVIARYTGEQDSDYGVSEVLDVIIGSDFAKGDLVKIRSKIRDPSLDLRDPDPFWIYPFDADEINICFLSKPWKKWTGMLVTEFHICTRTRGTLTGDMKIVGYGGKSPKVELFATLYPMDLVLGVISWLIRNKIDVDYSNHPANFPEKVVKACKGCAFLHPPYESNRYICSRRWMPATGLWVETLEAFEYQLGCYLRREKFAREVENLNRKTLPSDEIRSVISSQSQKRGESSKHDKPT
jgi:hypothetical protein